MNITVVLKPTSYLIFAFVLALKSVSGQSSLGHLHQKKVELSCFDAVSKKPVIGVEARVYLGDSLLGTSITDTAGMTKFILVPGKYDMKLSRPGYDEKQLYGFNVKETGAGQFLRISLFKNISVKGSEGP
jgi:hypothetical protein